ncbi:MgtC/SapB family protein [Occultella gossypii]|uniref:MgtC/SapB family protein n=1 Tax=Occultella gossypii TaxID=2800820 RepID=A0ABS7SJX3_9MICO|nr:MgtC/SapB family protein [Occultella gossypii]MBZ2199646.1 MgtC/SapB family protein [Occultella gossypii]
MPFATDTVLTELYLLCIAFVLCAAIGTERQVRQKAAGFRTHVLVGTGAAGFTLVSAFGFENVLGADVNLDPSRIAAQIVSGIGFLGAGVIFTRKDVVRGLTTAATIWVAAAVGMAAGAGMVALAGLLTALHLLCLVVLAPLVRRIPTKDRRRVLRLTYLDGKGVLRRILAAANGAGFAASLLSTRHTRIDGEDCVLMDLRFSGRYPLADLIPTLSEIEGIRGVAVRDIDDDIDDELA